MNGSTGDTPFFVALADKAHWPAGIVVDFLKIADAAARGVYLPSKAVFFSPSPDVAWPVVEFIPAKHAPIPRAKRTLIPQMAVDCMNASGKPEATRHQVPLILAWVSRSYKQESDVER